MDLNFQEKTDLILNKCQSESEGIENPFCIGISENLLTYVAYFTKYMDPKTFPLSEIPNTELKLSIVEGLIFRDISVPIISKIDVLNATIDFSISLRLEFYDTETPAYSFAVADFILQVESQPFMATSNKNHLAISISDIRLYGEITYPTLNSDEVIARFGSIPDFKQYVNSIIEKIRQHQVETEYNNVVPSVFSYMELPNTWKFVEKYEVKFERMYFEEGTLRNEPCGFLFIVFSVKSLMLPPPCLCLPDSQVDDDLQHKFSKEDRWITVGISRTSLQEIIKPYSHFGQRGDYYFISHKGPVYGEVTYWFQIKAGNFNIKPDGIIIDITFDSGGHITGYVRSPLGGDFGYEAAKVRVDINKITLQAIVDRRIRRDHERNGLEIYVKPHVEISDPKLEIEGPIPWPISEVVEKILEDFGSAEVAKLENQVNQGMTIPLFMSRIPLYGEFGFYFDRVDFFEESSIIITGIGTTD